MSGAFWYVLVFLQTVPWVKYQLLLLIGYLWAVGVYFAINRQPHLTRNDEVWAGRLFRLSMVLFFAHAALLLARSYGLRVIAYLVA